MATPIFTPPPGTYPAAQTVSIGTTTGGATIRYTTDGSSPSETAGTVYSSPLAISVNTTLQAIAYQSGMTDSTIASGVMNYPVRLAVLHPAARHLWERTDCVHQRHHQRRDHPLYHGWHIADRDCGYALQQFGEYQHRYRVKGNRLYGRHGRQ